MRTKFQSRPIFSDRFVVPMTPELKRAVFARAAERGLTASDLERSVILAALSSAA